MYCKNCGKEIEDNTVICLHCNHIQYTAEYEEKESKRKNNKKGSRKMEKIIVIGCPGSGKSTFSKKLNSVTNIPLYHLDNIYWKADKTTISKEELREKMFEIMKTESWIIDGNYNKTIELRLQYCDTVIFLDYDTDVCLKGVEERAGKERTDIPWVESAESPDAEFIELIKSYKETKKPEIMELLQKYSNKEIHIFKNRDEAEKYINNMKSI